jgi:hypothetical protein
VRAAIQFLAGLVRQFESPREIHCGALVLQRIGSSSDLLLFPAVAEDVRSAQKKAAQ